MQNNAMNVLLDLVRKGHRIQTDSRKASTGEIFVALRGERFDGNHYAAEALRNGCQLAVIDRCEYFKESGQYMLVENGLDTLQELSRAYRKHWGIPILSITGSNGKTTTKELIYAVLASSFRTFATSGNLNNHIGLPISLLCMKEPLDMAVLEMGANHGGEIARLCEIAQPTHGLITNIGKAHLEGFGSLDGVARAKGELYDHVTARNGLLFVNHNDRRLRELAGHTQGADKVYYGSDPLNHCSGEIVSSHPWLSLRFQTNRDFGQAVKGLSAVVRTRLTGAYNLDNILAALTVGLYFGVPLQKAAEAIEGYISSNHRSQIIQTGSNTVVMDAYNANPTSMAAALDNFSRFEHRQKAVLLGDMLELGKEAKKEHERILELVLKGNYDLKIFVGKHFMPVCRGVDGVLAFSNAAEAAAWLAANAPMGYAILIKGSRGIRMEQLLDHV